MRVAAPNILDGTEIYVILNLGKKQVRCRLTRVYYHDTARERRLWVDVRVVDMHWLRQRNKQKQFVRIAMENLDYRCYATVVSLSFKQEEVDIAFKKHLKEIYACRIDIRLTQECDHFGWYYWQGVMSICKYPSEGRIFVRGVNVPISTFTHVCITTSKPLVLCVKENNRIKVESMVSIRMGQDNIPLVFVDGMFMYITVHIGGRLFSGKNGVDHSVGSLGRLDGYGSPTTTL